MESTFHLWWNATTDLAAGTYNYTVTDANGCIAATSVTIDAVLHKITLTATPSCVCFGGKGSVVLTLMEKHLHMVEMLLSFSCWNL
jgi:predicted aspartyl protease